MRGPGKTFLLGVGCMKGGTSWLHDYLAASPQCEPGFRKEYHVFDGLDLPAEAWMRRRVLARARKAADAVEEGRPADATALQQASFYADPELYFDYFASLAHREERTRLVADITPAYAHLSVERLSGIRASFEERGLRTVAVFLMRDPVDRIWSQVRMNQGRRPEDFPGTPADWVAELYAQPGYEARTRYDHTLDALEQAFAREQVFYAFYERLFDPDVLGSLCSVLGIDYREPDLDRRVNESPVSEPLPDELVRTVARHYRPVYDAVARRFDVGALHELWPSSRLLD
jgi:hypothetical protein